MAGLHTCMLKQSEAATELYNIEPLSSRWEFNGILALIKYKLRCDSFRMARKLLLLDFRLPASWMSRTNFWFQVGGFGGSVLLVFVFWGNGKPMGKLLAHDEFDISWASCMGP